VEDWRANHPPDDAAPLEIIDGPDAPFHPEWI
jgi:hypothetical protein